MMLVASGLSATTKKHSSGTTKAASSKASTAHVKRTKATSGKHGKRSKSKKVRGQQVIDSERARAIQAALIREHYLDGEPSGSFDQRTKDALQRFQKDNGWQSKVIPDSRALIKLGLGPSKDGLLNPESAAMGSPYELGTEREIPGGAASPAQRK
jgi:peptidoglycan hydrolase-like protein with peptidoglycan-binding domain